MSEYKVLKVTRETEYCDEWQTCVSMDLERISDSATGNVWLLAGVPPYLQGTSRKEGYQEGFVYVIVPDFGSWDAWCSFERPEDEDECGIMVHEILSSCEDAALREHWAAYYERLGKDEEEG